MGALITILLSSYGLYKFNRGNHSQFFHYLGEEGPGIEAWSKFVAQNEHFSVFFPDEPIYSTKELSIPRSDNTLVYHEYRCRDKDKVISVSYAVLPNDWLKWHAKTVLKRTIKVLMARLKNTRLSGQSANTFKSYPALDFEHRLGERETAGTLVLCKNVLYKLEISYPIHEHDQMRRQITQFIASFQPSEVA